ncbi:fused DSP-PTPase phosphatase/NAD kinase-like protein [Haloferula sp.]|uniref:fused DSP-PTPase phosphatase/NAD kinase-like protein n=1 Tax=Haloferula sp. TaxID=2497595 RepID=UPI00329C7CCE
MNRRPWTSTFLIPAVACLLVTACIYTPATDPRPTSWAPPIENTDLPNLHRVSPDLYRCALPKKEGYDAAREMGIQTIVNLRPNKASQTPAGTIPNYVNIPVHTGAPSYDQAREFFRIVDDPKNQPVLLHCYHGADRTGAFTALYRINRQDWSKDEAIREMTGGGFQFHTMWKSLIEWVREAPEF